MPRRFVRAERKQQPYDLVDVRALRRTGHIARAAQCGDKRREPIVDWSVGVRADLEQRPDERPRAVINRVDEARSNRIREATIRNRCGVIDSGAQRIQIAFVKRVVDQAELFCLRAAFFFGRH
jgi:hypothetical protein